MNNTDVSYVLIRAQPHHLFYTAYMYKRDILPSLQTAATVGGLLIFTAAFRPLGRVSLYLTPNWTYTILYFCSANAAYETTSWW